MQISKSLISGFIASAGLASILLLWGRSHLRHEWLIYVYGPSQEHIIIYEIGYSYGRIYTASSNGTFGARTTESGSEPVEIGSNNWRFLDYRLQNGQFQLLGFELWLSKGGFLVYIPFLFPAFGLTVIVFIIWRSSQISQKVDGTKLCERCGYDLRASNSYCPECGSQI